MSAEGSSGTDRLRAIDLLFRRVLEVGPQEAEAILAAHDHDADLVGEVRELLAFDDDAGTTLVNLESGSLARSLVAHSGSVGPSEGERIGAYRLVEPIGQGGMGIVWLAERADGAFDQRVALKSLPAGSFSRSAVRRFERERQILARLNHDNIARLLDGGVDDQGRPFLAMELVEGESIVGHCDDRRLSLEDRLRLVVAAARAVQVAHRNLIVHCDLKPANLLVTADGVVKLLDFGIAELVGAEEIEETGGLTLRRLTPEYASPESLRGDPVTTASDIYQLGLLTYELCCGQRARTGSMAVADRRDREPEALDPEPPSRALGTGEVADLRAARRSTSVRRLRRAITGDLDAILRRSMASDPGERYLSAEALAVDLERYLERRPVEARPLGWARRTLRLTQRHPAVAALLLMLSVLLGGLLIQSRSVRVERDRAEHEAAESRALAQRTQEVSDFLVSMLTDASFSNRDQELTVVELLDRGTERTRIELAESTLARSEVEEILGRVYQQLGHFDRSLELLGKAVEVRRIRGDRSLDYASLLQALATSHNALGQHEATKRVLAESLELQREEPSPTLELANGLTLLSYVYGMLGELEPMLALRHESLEHRQALFGQDHLEVAQGLNDVCYAYKDVGEYARALDYCREAVAIRRRHGQLAEAARSLMNSAIIRGIVGDREGAERESLEALEIVKRSFPAGHHRQASARLGRGRVLLQLGEIDGASREIREARDIYSLAFDPEHRSLAFIEILLAEIDTLRGRPLDAERRLAVALANLRKTHTENQHVILWGRVILAEAMLLQGRREEALEHLRDVDLRLAPGRSEQEIWRGRVRSLLDEFEGVPNTVPAQG